VKFTAGLPIHVDKTALAIELVIVGMLGLVTHARFSTAAKFIHHRHVPARFVILSPGSSRAAGENYAKDLCILFTS